MEDIKINDNQIPVIKIGNLTRQGKLDLTHIQYFPYETSLHKYLIKKGDVLIAMTGATVGKVSVSDKENLLLNQRVGLVRANEEKIDKTFLDAILLSQKFYDYCQRMAGGGAQGNISPAKILSYEIPLPPLDVQKAIVAEIDGYQKIIDGARQVVENYKPIIKIDAEWEMVEFTDVCTLEYGASLPKKARKEGEYPVVGSNGITGWHNEYLIEPPAIIVGRKGSAGEVVFIDKPCFPIDTTYYVKLKKEEYDFRFLYFILKEMNLQKYKDGAGVPGLNRNDVYNREKIPLPPLSVQQEIVTQIEVELEMVNANKKLIEIYEQKIKDKIAEVWGE